MSSEIQVQVFIDGTPAERLGPFIELETEVRDNAYLGEVTTKYDSLFKVGGPRRRCSTKALAEREVQRRRQSRAGKGRAS